MLTRTSSTAVELFYDDLATNRVRGNGWGIKTSYFYKNKAEQDGWGGPAHAAVR